MEDPLERLLILSRSINKHGHHRQFLFLIGLFGANDIHGAVSDFTSIFLKIASICIPTREVIIRNDDKVWFDSTIL
jgi:hypothetical protein